LKSSTRYNNHFEWWSVADCDCLLCRFFLGRKRVCALDACCCEDIRLEALRREQAANTGATAREEAMACRA
jgi:hypothetical protein